MRLSIGPLEQVGLAQQKLDGDAGFREEPHQVQVILH